MRNLKRFASQWQNKLALAIVASYVVVAIAAPWLSPPADPAQPSPFKLVGKPYDPVPKPPNDAALLGTASGQLDIYHTLVWGTRSALRFGLMVALCTATLGVFIGATAGFFGGPLGGLTMRITDGFLAFPTIAGVWLLQQVMRPPSPYDPPTGLQTALQNLKLDPVTVTLILLSWMPYARIINTNVSQLKQTEYIAAAKSIGAGNIRIIVRHLLPNALAPAIVLAARDVGAMVLLESAFTFIGIGGTTEWGVLLVSSRDYIIGMGGNPLAFWWTFLPITLMLVGFGISWNLLGDGINNLLNPRTAS